MLLLTGQICSSWCQQRPGLCTAWCWCPGSPTPCCRWIRTPAPPSLTQSHITPPPDCTHWPWTRIWNNRITNRKGWCCLQIMLLLINKDLILDRLGLLITIILQNKQWNKILVAKVVGDMQHCLTSWFIIAHIFAVINNSNFQTHLIYSRVIHETILLYLPGSKVWKWASLNEVTWWWWRRNDSGVVMVRFSDVWASSGAGHTCLPEVSQQIRGWPGLTRAESIDTRHHGWGSSTLAGELTAIIYKY